MFSKIYRKTSMKTKFRRLKGLVSIAIKADLNIYRLCIFQKYLCSPANATMTINESFTIWELRIKMDDLLLKFIKSKNNLKNCKYLLTKFNNRKYFRVIYFLVVWSRSSWHTFHFHIGEYSDVHFCAWEVELRYFHRLKPVFRF